MFFASLFEKLAPARPILYVAVLLLIGGSFAGALHVEVCEDIEAMLPDGASSVTSDFRRLQQAPFSRKILITLRGDDATGLAALQDAADRMAASLSPGYFTRPMTGPALYGNSRFPAWMTEILPNILTEEDLAGIESKLTFERIESQVDEGYRRLLSPEGLLLKDILRRDPLDLRNVGFEKLLYLNPITKTRIVNGHFASEDGRSTLIIADTPVPITDSGKGKELVSNFQEAARSLPPGVRAKLISGHPYTLANAEAIQDDLKVVLGGATVAIVALFLLFLRNWRALFVFLVPVSVLGLATLAVMLCYNSVSGITIGFGAVLLGITVDFGLHVFFALRHGEGGAAGILARVSRPVLFGGVTTICAFAVLLFSDLPGQRQLAVFSMVGIVCALFLSLVILPHLLGGAKEDLPGRASADKSRPARRLPVVMLWASLLILCAWQARGVKIDGELRSLSLVPPELRAAEEEVRQTWGDMRSMAMVFAEGDDLQHALELNDRLFRRLSREFPDLSPVSLAPLLPSEATQSENRGRWGAFWREHRDAVTTGLQVAGERKRFSPSAFDPFIEGLDKEPAPVTIEELRSAGFGDLLNTLLLGGEGRCQVLTLVPDTPEVAAFFSSPGSVEDGLHFVSQRRFGQEISEAIAHDFLRFIALAGLLVLVILTILFRRPKKVLLALLPVVTGLMVMFGVMGWLGIAFNLFNIVATILIIGLGVDYGIFMLCRNSETNEGTERAVLVAGLTTLAGFGVLVLARHPALHSIGITVLLGIGASIPSALLVIPAFNDKDLA